MSCFMIKRARSGGGNRVGSERGGAALVLRRNAAIGDAVCSTVVADRLISMGFEITMQSHPACHCVLRLHPQLTDVRAPGGPVHINLDGAYENDPHRIKKHFHTMFFEAAQRQLGPLGINLGHPSNCRPLLQHPNINQKLAFTQKLSAHPKPWVMICPRSDSFNVRQVPDGIWDAAAKKVNGTCFWIGRHPGPPNCVDLNLRHFDNVLLALSVADLLATVDTGPLHVAAAFGVPCVAISQSSSPELHLNDQNDFISIAPPLDCLNCQKNLCPKNAHIPPCQNVDPDLIASWINARLHQYVTDDVSAIVTIFQPEASVLNKCLTCLLPQVQEIIVAAEGNSTIPSGALQNPKIRYTRTPQRKIGYGRNCNHGARHSNGKFMLLMNDDVFLDEHAVERMMAEMKDADVGAVSCLLRYPNGTIYHAGKVRSPGVRGWGHLDHRQWHPSWKEPCDVENMCGATVLVRRKAFYGIGGFDEDFFVYAEDDDFMLRLRRDGWRLRYTPHASGIHMEGQSTKKIGQPHEYIQHANQVFDRKWRAYFDHNLQRIPGTFDY